MLKAIDEGTTLGKFRERMNDWLEQRGYEGVTNYQADNIFRTNVQTAYQVGHWKQMTAPETLRLRPYWQYDAGPRTSARGHRIWRCTAGYFGPMTRYGIPGIPRMGSAAAVPSEHSPSVKFGNAASRWKRHRQYLPIKWSACEHNARSKLLEQSSKARF
ncbi:phage head morphogenesis protein [Paenibacillus melissococcoides]